MTKMTPKYTAYAAMSPGLVGGEKMNGRR